MVFVVASNRPYKFALSLSKLPIHGARYVAYVHESDRAAFENMLETSKLIGKRRVEIVTHNWSNENGVPFGKLRYHGYALCQELMSTDDIGFLLDDDLKAPRGVSKRLKRKHRDGTPNDKYWSFPIEPIHVIQRELKRLARLARREGFDYFTTSFNADGKCGLKIDTPFKPTFGWSGCLGFFKESPNPFDADFGVGADAEAQMHVLDKCGEFNVLKHNGLVFEFQINSKDYARGGLRDRQRNLEEIVRRYPEWARITSYVKKSYGTKTPNYKIDLAKGVRARLNGVPIAA